MFGSAKEGFLSRTRPMAQGKAPCQSGISQDGQRQLGSGIL